MGLGRDLLEKRIQGHGVSGEPIRERNQVPLLLQPEGIALPENLIKEIDKVVKKKDWGYQSRAELAKDAIRQLLLKLKKK